MVMVATLILPDFVYAAKKERNLRILPWKQEKQASPSAGGQDKEDKNQEQNQKICTRLIDATSKIDQKLIDRETKLQTRRNERLDVLTERRAKRDERHAENRNKWYENRLEHYTKLEKRVSTEEQKQAVAKFKAAVEEAIASRQASVDNAIQAFRTETDKLIIERKTAVDLIIVAFKAALKTATDKAKTDCEAGVDPTIVRDTLKNSIKAAREQFQNDIKGLDAIKEKIQFFTAQRKEAIRKAHLDFVAAINKAKQELRAAFPKIEEEDEETASESEGTASESD